MHSILVGLLIFVINVSFAGQTNSGLYFNTFGEVKNPAIIFLHGGPGYNSYSFEYGTAEELSKAGFYVVVYDQRSCGRSSDGIDSDFTFNKATQELLEVIQETHATHLTLLGHSWGGTLGLKFIKLHPGIAQKLILVDSPVSWPSTLHSMILNTTAAIHSKNDSTDELKSLERMNRMFPNALQKPFNFSLDDISDAFNDAMNFGLYRPQTYSPEALAIWQSFGNRKDTQWLQVSRAGPVIGFAEKENLYELDLMSELAIYRDKIFAIYGSEDRLFDQEQISNVTSVLGPNHVVQIPKGAHNIFIDQRADFIEVVRNLISSMY
jgi:proline iminopeptidase